MINIIEFSKEILWNTYFNINIKMKKYVFDYTIITDCYSASIRFIHKDQLQEEIDKKEKMRKGRDECKGLTNEEKTILKIKRKKNKKI